MSEPGVVQISGGSIEVRPAGYVRVTRKPDGTTEFGDSMHVAANLHVYLSSEEGFFAFTITPGQARELLAAVERHSPDA